MDFIGAFCLILVLTTLLGHVCQRIGFPDVVGEILVGMVCGPALLGILQPGDSITLFSDLGVIILMFLGGLGSDLELLKRYSKAALIIASMGVVFPVVVMGAASLLFGFDPMESAFIGVIFSATSVSVSVAVMKSNDLLGTKEGASILGAAVADDVIGVVLLSVMSTLATNSHLDLSGLGIIALEQVAFFAGVLVLVKWVAPLLMYFSTLLRMPFSRSIMAVVICLGVSWVSNLVGLSYAVGAFFAGIAVANSEYREAVQRTIQPIGSVVFIPFFFVGIGLNVTAVHSPRLLVFIAVMTVLGVITKIVGCGLGARIAHFDGKGSMLIGTGMVARGEMALITAQIGFDDHLLDSEYYSTIILVITLVTLLAPIIMNLAISRMKVGVGDTNAAAVDAKDSGEVGNPAGI